MNRYSDRTVHAGPWRDGLSLCSSSIGCAGWAACFVLVLGVAGCGGEKQENAPVSAPVNVEAGDFQRQVIQADRPVLLELYKGG